VGENNRELWALDRRF